MPARVARPEDLTLDDLVNIGVDGVTDRLPPALLLAAVRKYVQGASQRRERAKALAAERKAYGMAKSSDTAPDLIAAQVLAASMDAARNATMSWRPLLNIPFLVPTAERQVTWGSATVDEHRDRAEWLEHQAVGTIRTASHHRKAIEDISDLRVGSLLEVVLRGGSD